VETGSLSPVLPSILALILMQTQPGGPALEGLWRSPNETVIISIAPCGKALCGQVRWASEKAKADARRGGTDPLVGSELLSGLELRRQGRWQGQLFVPDLNRRSKIELLQLGPHQMKITGCAIGRLLCKSQVWRRAEAPSVPHSS
jgi:uncharacterized protein (DUF2147 family)